MELKTIPNTKKVRKIIKYIIDSELRDSKPVMPIAEINKKIAYHATTSIPALISHFPFYISNTPR